MTARSVAARCGWMRRLVAAFVGVDEDGDQIITLLICVHQIFEINGSCAAWRLPMDNFV